MRPSIFILLRITTGTLIGLICLKYSTSHAQTRSLKLCSETLYKTRQVINESKPSNLPTGIFSTLDPAYQKLQQTYDDWAECIKGQKAPLFPFETLNGEFYDTASLTGKIVVINFWFMSCAPCRAEFPAFNKLVEEYKGRNVLFLGFSTDHVDRFKSSFFEQNHFDFKIIAGAQNLANSFYVTGYPTTYIVDQRGIIRQAWIGFVGNGMDKLAPYHKAKSAIDKLLTTNSK